MDQHSIGVGWRERLEDRDAAGGERYSRDIGTLTFNGKVERVRELVEADPSIARTMADSDSLLLWLPRDDELRAVAIAGSCWSMVRIHR